MKLRLLLILGSLLVLAACADKTIATVDISTLTATKDEVIAAINVQPVSCAYKGRVAVQYEDSEQRMAFRSLLDKTCENYMKMTILGPFNMVMGELTLDNGKYTVVKDGEDISNTIFLNFTDAEFSMFMDSFRLPPATLDDDYEMSLTETGYLFYKNDYAVLISPDLKVSMLEADAYHAQYIWAGEALETIIVTMPYGIKMTFTLTDKWIAQ